ncbi:MAG: DUF5719 family protein, partial [Actinomycetia bacterium]|nr:DUF5719 family protein [Actinomycetes bacterium]
WLFGVSAADASNCWAVGWDGIILFGSQVEPTLGVWSHDSIGVTAPSNTWYLAEGATAGGFETWVLIQNPNDTPTDVTLTYMTDNGEVPGGTITVAPNSRDSVNVELTVQTYNVSTKATADKPVIAERAMYYSTETTYRQCAHSSIGVTAPSDTWYLAEGSTFGGFETWILVQNPGTEPATVTLTYQTDTGEVPGPTRTVQPGSRESFEVSQTVQTYEVSTTVTSDKPVIAERAMYWSTATVKRQAAHDSIGVTMASDTWYLAEGATAGGFETWVLVQNPNETPARVTLTYMTENGEVPGGTITLPANSRENVNVGETVRTFKVSTKVTADQPVIAERAMYGDAK